MRLWRTDFLQWVVAIFCALLGAIMLITPHQFTFLYSPVINPFLLQYGAAFLAIGSILLAVIVFNVSSALTWLAHLIAGMALTLLAVALLAAGALFMGTDLLLLGVAALFSPALQRKPSSGLWRDLFGLVFAVSSIVNGAIFLAQPGDVNLPFIRMGHAEAIIFGALLIAAGLFLGFEALLPPTRALHIYRQWAARIFASIVYVGVLLFGAIPQREWLFVSLNLAMIAGLLIFPKVAGDQTRLNPSRLQSQLALGFALATALPLIAGIAIFINDHEALVDLDRGRDLTMGLLLGFLFVTIAGGVYLARRMSEPLESLANAIQSVDENSNPLPVVQSNVVEIRELTAAFNQMVARLQERTREREAAEEELRSAHATLEKRVEERTQELHLANLRLRAMLDALPVAVWITDETGRMIQINRAVEMVWGEGAPPMEDVSGYAAYQGWNVRSRKPLKIKDWPLARALSGETVFSEMVDIQRFDGRSGTIMTGGAPVVDQNGRFLGAVAVAQDITEQRHMEALAREAAYESRQSAIEFEAVFNALSDAVVVYNEEGVVQRANSTAIALYGFDPLGLHRENIFRKLTLFSTEGSQLTTEMLPSSRLVAGETQINQRFSVINARGRRYIILASAAPLYIGQDLMGIVSIWHDVTEREKLFSDLTLERARLQALMDSAPAGIIMIDQDGHFLLSTPKAEELLGVRLEGNILGDNDSYGVFRLDGSVMPPEEYPMVQTLRAKAPMRNQETMIQRKDGRVSFLLVNTAPLFDDHHQLAGAIAVMQDITELRQAQNEVHRYAERLERSNSELEQFAFVASHDLQEPLRKIKFFGERLEEQFKEDMDEREIDFLQRMIAASRRMQTMIEDLLTYSRITTKARPFEEVDLNDVAREVASDLEVRLERSGGQLHVEYLPAIWADAMQMHQLFQNLINNGLKFHREGVPPVVRVWADKDEEGEAVLLSFEDNGIGFDMQYMERIFQPFERLHGRSEYEGSGMGLAICKKIVERHQGSITARSEEGQGTTFTITLPVHPVNEDDLPAG